MSSGAHRPGPLADAAGITAVRRLHFCAGHRVLGHEGKCAHVHGHNYVVFVHARVVAGSLDGVGRVVDFGVLKERLGGWLDQRWDHGFLFYREDAELAALYAGPLKAMKHFVCDWNPTAENIARYLLEAGDAILDTPGVVLAKVEVWETENCVAVAEAASPPTSR